MCTNTRHLPTLQDTQRIRLTNTMPVQAQQAERVLAEHLAQSAATSLDNLHNTAASTARHDNARANRDAFISAQRAQAFQDLRRLWNTCAPFPPSADVSRFENALHRLDGFCRPSNDS